MLCGIVAWRQYRLSHTLWYTTGSQAKGGHDVRSSMPRRSGWLRWIFWLTVGVVIAVAAQFGQEFSSVDWTRLVWLLPLAILVAIVFTALWGLLGSRRSVAPVRAGGSKGSRRRTPRHPRVHLQELQRSGEYWAIMLRLPQDGACDAAKAMRQQVFDLYRAPSLPISGCSSASCKCGYSGLKNRRRRDVLPSNLERDRRAGAVIAWHGDKWPAPPEPHEIARPQGVAPRAEVLRP